MTEKIEQFWRDATADDVARVMNRETVEARFRDSDGENWRTGRLNGWADGEFRCDVANCWRQCQVYRELSWYADKPDPGPGYRLLGKFPDEELTPGDEVWEMWRDKQWAQSDNAKIGKPQSEEVWYRRRIEPVEPEPKFAVGQMVRLVGPKGSDAKQWSEKMITNLGKELEVSNRENIDARWYYKLGCSATWAFREDYLEAVYADRRIVVSAGDVVHHPNGSLLKITEKGFEVTQ